MTLSVSPCLRGEYQKEFIPLRPAELKVFRKRSRLPGPQWFERNVNVPIGSRQGLYQNKNNPAMHGVLDYATRHHVRTIVLGKGIQVGGTLAVYGLLLREGDYSTDSALVVMADERSLKKLFKKRLIKMIEQSPTLSALKSSNPDETTQYSITLANGFTVDGAWASSEASVSSESYRIVILDEISKYKTRGNIEDAKARTTVFPDTHKIWILSSPGIDTDDPDNRDPLTKEAESCDTMMEFHAVCPDCGGEQVMTFGNFKWPGQATLTGEIEADPGATRRNRSAWYQCEHCQSRWNDYKRDKAVLSGMKNGWKSTDGCAIESPRSIYFHFPSWLSPYVSLSDVVADWLEAQGDEAKLQKWYNRHGGVAYRRPETAAVTEEHLLAYRSELPRNLIPLETARLALLVDTQQNCFKYQVWSLGYAPEIDMHMVRHGILESFSDLDGLIESTWEDVSGGTYRITIGLIDSGGTRRGWQKHSRTVEVYSWCSGQRVMLPIKGIPGRAGEMLTYKQIETLPGSNKPIKGGLKRANIRVDIFKDLLERILAKQPDDAGALSFHADIDSAFAKEYTAEIKDKNGDWIHERKRGPNDYFDCNVYAIALREMLKMRHPLRPDSSQQQSRRIFSKGVQSNG